jgi:hydroxymethylpyrimidine/phosphomethylpyrimidine kinase
MSSTPLRLLTIAGSDSGGGAGIQADLKTFAAHGAYGMSAVTAVTAQDTVRVSAVEPLPAALVAAQIDAVIADIGVDAIKIGMLAGTAIVEAVAERLAAWRRRGLAAPVVLDPVMVAKSGDPLLAPDAVEALSGRLLPLATLITPNLPEAARLAGLAVANEEERREAARALARRGPAVLVKGGHGAGEELLDLLFAAGRFHAFRHARIATSSTHGTGCTLSAAIACRLAEGQPLSRAVESGIDYLRGALASAFPLGHGHGPVHHFYRQRVA